MRSLRAQVLALVVASVLMALVLLAYFGTRTASVQFRAIVASTRVAGDSTVAIRLDSALARGGIDEVRRVVEGAGRDSLHAVVVGLDGTIVASGDSGWRGRRAVRTPGGGLRVELGDTSDLRRIEISHGTPLRRSLGDTAAFVFAIPRPDLRAAATPRDLEVVSRGFARRFGRALWLGIPALLAAAAFLAVILTGRLLDPIRRLTTAAQGIAAGDYGTRVGRTSVSELRELAAVFDRMAESLERSEGARRQVMRDLAHELRTPLTNLKAQIESLQDGLRTVDAASLASLHEEATVLERLVGDVDVLARADAGRLEMHLEPLALRPLVEATIDAFVHAGRIDASRISAHVPEDLGVHADRVRLGQVLRNLIDNAMRHGGAGVTVHVGARRTGDHAVLSVVDTGEGIAPEHVPRVFDRLYRVDPSRTRATGGSGLGLSIAQALVEAQGGLIRLESATGRGTTVTVELPARNA
ncbi:MAG: HAMP domain-containing protein [Gemmatimonadaceae bacterium]|nr:HAMP domain-containing protein [Gemmatimonadaceae bacterium]